MAPAIPLDQAREMLEQGFRRGQGRDWTGSGEPRGSQEVEGGGAVDPGKGERPLHTSVLVLKYFVKEIHSLINQTSQQDIKILKSLDEGEGQIKCNTVKACSMLCSTTHI